MNTIDDSIFGFCDDVINDTIDYENDRITVEEASAKYNGLQDRFKQALYQDLMALVGEDEEYTKDEADGNCEDMDTNIKSYMKGSRNHVRAELRQSINQYFNRGESDEPNNA